MKMVTGPDSGQRVACLDSCKDMAVQAMPPPQPGMKRRTARAHEHVMGSYHKKLVRDQDISQEIHGKHMTK